MASSSGMYAALMGKNKNKGSPAGGEQKQKVKAAKVLSLKDTKEKKPAVSKTAPKKEEPKKEAPKAEEPEPQQTKRQMKDEKKSTDRHVPRSGHAPESKGQKTDAVTEAVQAMDEKPAKELDEREKKQKEEAEAREKEREEEAKRITFADYQKTLEAKKLEMKIKPTAERKVDQQHFKKMVAMAKDDDDSMFVFAKKEVQKETKAAAPAKKGGKAPEPVSTKKKTKFTKNTDIQLGFRNDRDRPRRPPRQNGVPPAAEKPEETAAAPVEEAAAPAEEQA